MLSKKDLTGQKFGRLKAIKESGGQGGRVYWECQCDCGKIKSIYIRNLIQGFTKSYGCLLAEIKKEWRGPKHGRWKGGRTVANGYVSLLMRGHPDAYPNGYVLEHRFIMGNSLSRLLGKDETVHHKNGIKTDNRIENLELRLKKMHSPGQSIQDLIPYWKEMLKRYAPHELKEE